MADDATQAMPPTEPPAAGGGTGDEDGDDRRKLWLIIGGVVAVVLLLGALVAVLASGGGDSGDAATDGSSTSSSSTSSSTASTSPSTTQGNTGTTKPQTTNPTQPPATGPQITSFSANPNFVVCQPGGSASTTVSWTTSNASQTTLSIDGPGVYGTYGPSGSVTSGPGCPGSEQSQTHTYLVTAKGPGGQTQKTISVKFMAQPGA